jgi:hypothetical protein
VFISRARSYDKSRTRLTDDLDAGRPLELVMESKIISEHTRKARISIIIPMFLVCLLSLTGPVGIGAGLYLHETGQKISWWDWAIMIVGECRLDRPTYGRKGVRSAYGGRKFFKHTEIISPN